MLCVLALVTLNLPAQAATPVSGVIGSSTNWTSAHSPIVLQGDVILDNNATLDVAAGVEIRMAPQASFTVKRGALQFNGTADSPIVVKSDAAAPAPGDWGQWRFTAGTDGARTILNHTSFAHGSGLVIEGASPVLNNVAINHQNGPAISIDLAASPLGTGLSATGNTLNAIVVPAGTIRTPVVWGLVGIPYLIEHGLLDVGSAPIALEPARLKLSPGVVALVRLSLGAPAPSGGHTVDLTSSVPSVASVAARATVPQDQLGVDVEIQAQAIGKTTITASHAQLGMATADVEVVDLPAMEITPSQPTIGVNRSRAMSLLLPQAAPASGLAVALSNSDSLVLQAPSNLRVAAGQTGVDFEVTGLRDGTVHLTAQADGFASALGTVTVRDKALVLPGSVIVAPGAKTPVQIDLTEPAPSGGLTVTLTMSPGSAVATVPASVAVPAGQSHASVEVSGTALGTAQLSVSANGYQGSQATVRVDAIAINLEPDGDISVSREQSLTRRVQLSKPAPAGGVKVQVSTADPAIAKATPSEVRIPEGQIYGLVPISITGVAIGQTTLTVAANGLSSKTVNVTVQEKTRLGFVIANGYAGHTKVSVGKGLYTYDSELRVQRLINGVAANSDPVTVKLRCVSESVCTVPATVTIPANQSMAYISVTGVDLGSTQIEATAAGFDTGTVDVETVTPQISILYLDNARTILSARDNFYVQLQVPGANNPQYTTTALTVNLALNDQNPAGVVPGIYTAYAGGAPVTQAVIAAGQAYSELYVGEPSQAGTYRVAADIPNLGSAQSELQTVSPATRALKLVPAGGRTKVSVGKGFHAYDNYGSELLVQRLINGTATVGAEAVTVKLRCVSESVCAVPATVTIRSGWSYAYVHVTGVDLGGTQIEAMADGFDSDTVDVETVTPQVDFLYLDNARTPASARDNFTVRLQVPGATRQQYAATALTVNLALSDQNPAGVVSGIYTANDAGGALVTQTSIAAGANQTQTLYVGQPSQAGTYRVAADIPNIVSVKSEVQTVLPATQAFAFVIVNGYSGRTKVNVGKGLYTDIGELYVYRIINGAVAGGAEAVTVNLRCVSENVCTVPETVTIPANQSYAHVRVTGVDLGSTQIEATAAGFDTGAVIVETVTPQLRFYSTPPNSLNAGDATALYVAVEVPSAYYNARQYPAVPLTVTFTSSVPSAATVTASANWPASRSYSDVATLTGMAPGTTQITASVPGFAPVTSGIITINP
jgi:hypothetical protein